jgi:N-methylhydantoinase B
MLPDVILGCLNQVIPDRVPAEGTSCLWNPVLLGGHGLTEYDYGNAQPFAMNTFHSGGTGARPSKDGLDATAFPSGVKNTPIEINETIAPLIFWKKEYRTDSGGPGTHRGGVGQVMEISHAEEAPFAINSMFDRVIYPPRGRNGGGNGQTGRLYLKSGKEMKGKGRQSIPAGDRLIIEMPGGGGLGKAEGRDLKKVKSDVKNGFVSEVQAKEIYKK